MSKNKRLRYGKNSHNINQRKRHCDDARHRKCEARKATRKTQRDRSHLPGLSTRQTRILKRLADGCVFGASSGIGLVLMRARAVIAKARWGDVQALVRMGLATIRFGLTVAGKALLDHCCGPDPDVPTIAPTKRVLTMQSNIRHEAGAALATSLKARGAI